MSVTARSGKPECHSTLLMLFDSLDTALTRMIHVEHHSHAVCFNDHPQQNKISCLKGNNSSAKGNALEQDGHKNDDALSGHNLIRVDHELCPNRASRLLGVTSSRALPFADELMPFRHLLLKEVTCS
jgi:hypothetical protein